MTNRPMTKAERRAYNQNKAYAERLELLAPEGPRRVALAWWDRARAITKQRTDNGEQGAWNELAEYLKNFCEHYGK